MITQNRRWFLPGLLCLALSVAHAIAGPDEWQKHTAKAGNQIGEVT